MSDETARYLAAKIVERLRYDGFFRMTDRLKVIERRIYRILKEKVKE